MLSKVVSDHLLAANTVLVAHPASPDRLPLHVGTASVVTSGRATHGALSLCRHGTARAVSGIEGGAAPGAALVGAPASLAGEHGVVEAVERAGTSTVNERSVAQDGDVVEAEVPDRGVHHAVAAEGHKGADDRAGEHIVPVVELVNGEGATDQAGTKKGCVESDELVAMVSMVTDFGQQVQSLPSTWRGGSWRRP